MFLLTQRWNNPRRIDYRIRARAYVHTTQTPRASFFSQQSLECHNTCCARRLLFITILTKATAFRTMPSYRRHSHARIECMKLKISMNSETFHTKKGTADERRRGRRFRKSSTHSQRTPTLGGAHGLFCLYLIVFIGSQRIHYNLDGQLFSASQLKRMRSMRNSREPIPRAHSKPMSTFFSILRQSGFFLLNYYRRNWIESRQTNNASNDDWFSSTRKQQYNGGKRTHTIDFFVSSAGPTSDNRLLCNFSFSLVCFFSDEFSAHFYFAIVIELAEQTLMARLRRFTFTWNAEYILFIRRTSNQTKTETSKWTRERKKYNSIWNKTETHQTLKWLTRNWIVLFFSCVGIHTFGREPKAKLTLGMAMSGRCTQRTCCDLFRACVWRGIVRLDRARDSPAACRHSRSHSHTHTLESSFPSAPLSTLSVCALRPSRSANRLTNRNFFSQF